jgi:hypothetical protein
MMIRRDWIRALLYVTIGVLLGVLVFGDHDGERVTSIESATVPCDRDMARFDVQTLEGMIARTRASLRDGVQQSSSEAWAFVLDRDDAQRHYSTAILAHARAIRHWSFVKRPITLLVSEQVKLSREIEASLAAVDVAIVRTFRIPFDRSRLLAFKNIDRLHLWRLPFERVVFVAPEVALLRNVEYLFQYPDFAVVPNPEAPDQFRTSLLVLRPNNATFEAMVRRLGSYQPTWDTSEQAFLSVFFNDTQTMLPWSSCPSVRTLYMRAELWDFRDITCLHWSQFPPWTWQKRTDLRYLQFHWYDYLDRYVPERRRSELDEPRGWPNKTTAE